jgi:four helix bundle protein
MGMEDLTIYQKVYDLMIYSMPIVNRLPKSQRFILGQRIQNSMLAVASLIVKANKLRNKMPLLYELDIELEQLRLLIRVAKDLKYLPIRKYENHVQKIDEIGRLLGGWIKKAQGRG